MVAFAPVVADALEPVDHQRIDAQDGQPGGDSQPGLAAADHQNRGLAVFVGLGLAAEVGPVVGAILPGIFLAARAAFADPLLMALDHIQGGREYPAKQAAWLIRVRHQPQQRATLADSGFERDDRLDAIDARA